MHRPHSRRTLLRYLVAAPLTGAVASACGSAPRTDDAGGVDAGGPGADGGPGVDAGPGACRPTADDAQGPFYEDGAPSRLALADASEAGVRLMLSGRILSAADCATPLAGYPLDLWQADAAGNYHTGDRLRGVFTSNADGGFALETVMPGNYPDAGGYRPAHIHAKVWTPSGALRLTTQIYFAGDPYLHPNDSCAPPICDSGDPGRIVMLRPERVGGTDGQAGSLDLIVGA